MTASAQQRPTLVEMAISKRARLLVALTLFCALAFVVFYHADDLNNLRGVTIPAAPLPLPVEAVTPALRDDIDWTRFAYAQYVTNSVYLCNSVMFFAKLFQLGSKADRVMMYPSTMLPDPEATEGTTTDSKLIIKARDQYGVKLSPVKVQHKSGHDATWADSFTKLLAFNQTQYDRVLSMDSDSTILQNMDELFLLPKVPFAAPRAYWLYPDEHILSSQIMLVTPSVEEFARVQAKVDAAGSNDYDMEIVNQLYRDSALIIPHRPYNLLTGEFKGSDHKYYLGSETETWDPLYIYNEAKFVHFSDWPIPKPWIAASEAAMQKNEPACVEKDGQKDCTSRQLWNSFYTEFRERRKVRFSRRGVLKLPADDSTESVQHKSLMKREEKKEKKSRPTWQRSSMSNVHHMSFMLFLRRAENTFGLWIPQ